MSTPAPVITIYVRHSAGCKYTGEEFARRCSCRKHFRWTKNGKQHRRTAGTRSWTEAEKLKRDLEDSLAGRGDAPKPDKPLIGDAVEIFVTDKRVQGISSGVLGKYARELARFREYCERRNVFAVEGITRELLTGFCSTWATAYPSSTTRAKVRERLRSFLRYCYESQWVPRISVLPKMRVEAPPTMPLTEEQYANLLDAIPTVVSEAQRARVRALFQLMRWSGLAIRDALTLRRSAIETGRVYRVTTTRQKTGRHISVPIPDAVAQELLAVSGDPYVFWSGTGQEESITKNWAKYYIAPVFRAAGLDDGQHMMSHRLRDTFAVDLLSKGVPMEEVSRALGHESIRTTEKHYAKWVQSRQDRLDDLISGSWVSSRVKSQLGTGDVKTRTSS